MGECCVRKFLPDVTFAAYEEGVQAGLWPRISWVEKIIAERRGDESLEAFVYRYLDARSRDPSDGIFSRPLIQRMLRHVREKFRLGSPPELGLLGSFVGN